jgi:hypothetical protein
MHLKEVMVAWNPGGAIQVWPWPDKIGWSNDYLFTWGACYTSLRNMQGEDAKKAIFIQAVHIMVKDNVTPNEVHNALCLIKEYRAGLSYDCPVPDCIKDTFQQELDAEEYQSYR